MGTLSNILVTKASSTLDFEVVATFCDAFEKWDIQEAKAYGVSAETVVDLFHGNSAADLRRTYLAARSQMFLGWLDGTATGCCGYAPFTDSIVELQKFYVDPEFRRKGTGQRLMREVLRAIRADSYSKVLLHTTVYMEDAISLYRLFGFEACPAFRAIPDEIRHTEVFMALEF